MIEKYVTGITNGNRNSSLDFPCVISDTFYTGSKIFFCHPLSDVNSLLGLGINAGNLSTFGIAARITTNSSGEPNIESSKTNSMQIVGNFLIADVSTLLSELSHDYLLSAMSTDEIFSLHKQFFISYIIGQPATINTQISTFLPSHIIHPINIVLNTFESGPYDVKFNQIDLCSPFDFTTVERQTIYNANPIMIGGESIRTFYPTNLPSGKKSPLIFAFHGNNQLTENYDFILSTAASYGYVGFSVSIDQTGITPVPGYAYAIKLIDHIKANQSKIQHGLFNNKLDFNKINLTGHSRGGDLIDYIGLGLKYKNGEFSKISTSTLSLSDLKCMFPIGQVNSGTISPSGLVNTSESSDANPNLNTMDFFKRNHNVPTLSIRAKNDIQSGPEAHTTLMQTGYDEVLRLNTIDKGVFIFDNAEHAQLADYYFKDFVNAGINAIPPSGRIETNHTFNSTSIPRNAMASSIIKFMAINNFSANKLKKLRFIDYRIQNQNNNFGSKVPYHEFFYNKNTDLKHVIHSFEGATMSFAGLTGFTISPSIGHTFDFAIDSDYFNIIHGGTFAELEFNKLNLLRFLFAMAGGVDYTNDIIPLDTFNGIMDFTYKGLFIPIESDISLGYTFTSPLNLTENNYLGLRGALIAFYDPVQIGNTLNANFNITLIDVNNNSSTLSSKNSSQGFEKEFRITTGAGLESESSMINNCVPTNIFFRVGDFAIKNTSIGITQINQIRFDFGPSRGSTFAHLAFDEFVVYNEF